MEITVHHRIHAPDFFKPDPRVEAMLARLDALEAKDAAMSETMKTQLDALRAEVEQNRTVIGSAVTMIDGLADKVEASAGDPLAVAQVVQMIREDRLKLAAALAENLDDVGVMPAPSEPTPAEPAPEQPAPEQPAEPAPAEPVVEQPAEPVVETPAEPAPAEPVAEQPATGEQPAEATPPSEIQG